MRRQKGPREFRVLVVGLRNGAQRWAWSILGSEYTSS